MKTKYDFDWVGEKIVSREQIVEEVKKLAQRIDADYTDLEEPLLVIGLLRGAFIFQADLVRAMEIPVEIDFLTISSYGNSQNTSRQHQILTMPQTDLKGRHVLVVDDILDTGLTFMYLDKVLKELQPASLNYCALFDKAERRDASYNLQTKYLGPKVPNVFLFGYGLDGSRAGRNFVDVHALKS